MSPLQSETLTEDDDDNVDPRVMDETLAKELLQLTMQERTACHEEVHGVRNTAIEEAPQLIHESLQLLAFELEEMIPPGKKQAYMKSQTFPNTYVNTAAFRLRFLRCTLFDPTRAAKKIVVFLERAFQLFGEAVLRRAVRIQDFQPDELRALRLGRMQFLPFGDRSQRRIFSVFPDEVWENFPINTRAKISMYLSWTAGNDVHTQRNGLVFLVWFSENFKVSKSPAAIKDTDVQSVRASGVHLCSPDTPLFRFRRAIIAMRLGPNVRPALRVHLGTTMEIKYGLQGYGIPVDHIPISYNGVVKISYIKQWVSVRRIIEESDYEDSTNRNGNGTDAEMYEYPAFNDVVFRSGFSNDCHPGNSRFRSRLESSLVESEAEKLTTGFGIKRRSMILKLIEEVQEQGGRFLVWNSIGGWNQLHDLKQIIKKIESIAKEVRKKPEFAGRVSVTVHHRNSRTSILSKNCESDDTMCCKS